MRQLLYDRLLALAFGAPDPSLGESLLHEAQRRQDPVGLLLGHLLLPAEERWSALRALLLEQDQALRAALELDATLKALTQRLLAQNWHTIQRDYETKLGSFAASLAASTPLILSFCNALYIEDDTQTPAVSPWFQVLHHPSLSGLASLALDDIKGPACAKHILTAEHLKKLVHLSLCGGLQEDDARALLRGCAKSLPNLQSLDLSWNNFTSDQIAVIFQGATCTTLNTLDLSGNHTGQEGALALATAPCLQNLRRLDLTFNEVDAYAAQALLRSTTLKSLESLNLSGNHIGPEGAEFLAQCEALQRLKALHLGWCGLTDQGIRALANSPFVASLLDLDLLSSRIGPRGALALASSPFLSGLQSLNLSGNPIGARGIEAIKKSPCLSRLRRFTYDR